MTTTPATPTIRPARADELAAAARVYVAADEESDRRLYGRVLREPISPGEAAEDGALADLRLLHGEEPGRVWVAVREGGEVVGVAAAAVRGRHWHLVYLFVLPGEQGRGIGRGLLERVSAMGVGAGCDRFTLHASDDSKALTRYLRLGLAPAAPTVVLRAEAPIFPPLRWDDGLEAHRLDGDDPAQINTVGDIDAVVRGVRRAADLRRWLGEGASGALLTRRETGAPAGYFLVESAGDRGRIGPVAAIDAERVGDVVGRALAAARERHRPGVRWRVDLPGENRAAVVPMLDAGFRPERVSNFFGSAPLGRFDRYVFHDEAFL